MNDQDVNITDAARTVLQSRYLRRDSNGQLNETPGALFRRVANTVAAAERNYGVPQGQVEQKAGEFYNLMARGIFMPNSPTLMNAGRAQGILSACFVLPVEDSIEGIFTSVLHAALIQKAGGGTGYSFSRLRPKGDRVASSGGVTSGPMAFMTVFSGATSAIQQGAFRRGANMGVLRVDHPDIIEFINAKRDVTRLTNFNLSVAITDDFMRQVLESPDQEHMVRNPRGGAWKPLRKEQDGVWKVGEVFDLIVKHAWETGEPGVIFIDRINVANPTPQLGGIEATNPCGEQPLLPYESCNLGSINLSKFITQTPVGPSFDAVGFAQVVPVAVRFLDDVIDANYYPIPECEHVAKGNRKIGLGVMGFADLLVQLGVPYDSDEVLAVAERVMSMLSEVSHDASRRLAQEKGTFPNWEKSTWGEAGTPMRNAATTTIAPTGSVSIIADCSGGIEPLFSVVFERNVLNGQRILEINKHFANVAKQRGFYSDALLRKIHERGSLQGLDEVPKDIQKVFVTAHDVSADAHVRMQAAFQKHCDAAVSKTVNLPHDAEVEEVRHVFLTAHKLGCKGVTVYRDKCREDQPMALAAPIGKSDTKRDALQLVRPLALPDVMSAIRIKQATPFGNMHVKIVVDSESGLEREVFAQLGKGGDLANADLEAICRLTSLYLRVNGSIDDVVGQLRGIGSSISIPTREGRICSLADGIARGIEKYLQARRSNGLVALLLGKNDGSKQENRTAPIVTRSPVARENLAVFRLKCTCGADLCFTEGCTKCMSCGYAEC